MRLPNIALSAAETVRYCSPVTLASMMLMNWMLPAPVEVSVEPVKLPRTTALLNNWSPVVPAIALRSVFTIALLSWIVPATTPPFVSAVTVNAPRAVPLPMLPLKIASSAAFTVKVCVPRAAASIVLAKVMSPVPVPVFTRMSPVNVVADS